MLILGLDPSLSCTGWGIVRSEGARLSHVAHGQVATETKAPMAERLHHLHDAIVHAAQSAAQVVVDLTEAGVCDSAGVGAVVHASTRLNEQGVEVQVMNLHAATHR